MTIVRVQKARDLDTCTGIEQHLQPSPTSTDSVDRILSATRITEATYLMLMTAGQPSVNHSVP